VCLTVGTLGGSGGKEAGAVGNGLLGEVAFLKLPS